MSLLIATDPAIKLHISWNQGKDNIKYKLWKQIVDQQIKM